MAEVETIEAVEFTVVAKIKYTNKNHRRSLLKTIREFLTSYNTYFADYEDAKLLSLRATQKK
jgi:hypothetical protein